MYVASLTAYLVGQLSGGNPSPSPDEQDDAMSRLCHVEPTDAGRANPGARWSAGRLRRLSPARGLRGPHRAGSPAPSARLMLVPVEKSRRDFWAVGSNKGLGAAGSVPPLLTTGAPHAARGPAPADIAIFDFIKRATKGELLWLRATGSTVISQVSNAPSLSPRCLHLFSLPYNPTGLPPKPRNKSTA